MEFYILHDNTKLGPYSIEELSNKDINGNTNVWSIGFSNWKPAKEVPELAELLAKIPPLPHTNHPMPKTWLIESILVTLFCCLPFGIVGIINASKVESAYYRNYEEAVYLSKQAKKWTLWGVATAAICTLVYLFMVVLLAFTHNI